VFVKKSWLAALAAAAAALASISASAQEQPGSSLPGGASSLQETYQDWRLACQSAGAQTVCSITQEQQQQNGQRVLAIELLRAEGKGALVGNLMLPFGLQLDAGAVLQIDDRKPGEPLRFSTCMPAGCLVPLSFDPAYVTALRAGTVLRVKVQSVDAKEVALSISVTGFSAAFDRLQVLGTPAG
jgi:invasion protein IalB